MQPDTSFDNEDFYTNKKNFFKLRQDIAEGSWLKLKILFYFFLVDESCEKEGEEGNNIMFPLIMNKMTK